MHRAVGVLLMFIGGFVVHHSFDVFDVEGSVKIAVDVLLAFMTLGFVAAYLIGLWVGSSDEAVGEGYEQLLVAEEQRKRSSLEDFDMGTEHQ